MAARHGGLPGVSVSAISTVAAIATIAAIATVAATGFGCGGDAPRSTLPLSRPAIDRQWLRDRNGRYLTLHGVNVSGSTKVPAWVREAGGQWRLFTKDDLDLRPTAYDVSFVGRPFAVDPGWKPGDGAAGMGFENVRSEVRKLHHAGFDSFRLLVIWEAVEPRMRGVYDTEYLHYLRRVVEICNEENILVLVDFHHDMVSRFFAARYNDKPWFRKDDGTIVEAEPESLEAIVLSLFGPYTDHVRGDGMPKWAVWTALPEKDLRAENEFWGTPRIVGRFDPGMLCKVYKVYTWIDGGDPADATAQFIDFACGRLDTDDPEARKEARAQLCDTVAAAKDDVIDPWIRHVAAYACNTEFPIGPPGTDPTFAPEKSCDMLPWSQWSIGSIVSLDAERANTAMFGSDRAFPGLYARECRDGRTNPHELWACPADKLVLPTHPVCRDPGRETWQTKDCKDVREEYWSVKDYLQDAYAKAWVQVVDAVEGLPNVIGYDLMNEPVGYNTMLALQALVQTGGVNDGMILDLAKSLVDDPIIAETFARVVPALGLIPSLPPVPAEPVAPVAPVPPTDPGAGASQDAKDRYLVEKALYAAAKEAYDADKAKHDADAATFPDRKKAAEDERRRVLKSWGLVWEGPDNAEPAKAGKNADGTIKAAEFTTDLFSLIDLNTSFDWSYLRPFYQRVGAAILEADPDALLFIEGSMGLGSIGYDLGMPTPDGLEGHVVFAPHHYEDIYPFIGFNMNPRFFKPEEVEFRDYTDGMKGASLLATRSLGNAPVVFGEFGSYFNFNFIEQSVADDYVITKHILDNYFEGFESLNASRMLWCYSPDNDMRYGDLWNKEDFSIQGFDGKWRAEEAWSRPHARALAGRPISTHFHSALHFFEPEKGVPNPVGEFEVRYAAKETDSPSEIQVPYDIQYPDGFFVWLSDGIAYYDHSRRTLYHLPSNDAPGAEHRVRLLPPIEGRPAVGWQYFFRGDRVVVGD
ncbi:MAG: cellulase family glycosylhydrolase [Deltaproteobacteria bacterium]|nr:cellulase family glycosylhydrolase [Deltaproteobacteria bacterium]